MDIKIRHPKILKLKIKFIKPFIFRECRKCGFEFRRINMWSFKDPRDLYGSRAYLCTECARDYKDVLACVLDTKTYELIIGKKLEFCPPDGGPVSPKIRIIKENGRVIQ